MTTIAVNKKSMSCDLQFTHSGGMKFKGFSKCIRLAKNVATSMFGADKVVIGASGDADKIGRAWDFLNDPMSYNGKVPGVKGCEFVALTSEGDILTSSSLVSWIKVDQECYAIGTGSHFAMGAMEAGGSTTSAITAATKHDPNTGMGVKTYKVN